MNKSYFNMKTVGLNNYERNFFRKFFGTNLNRLRMFRKSIAKEQREGFYNYFGKVGTYKNFHSKGGKMNYIWLSKKKVDAYINEVN